MLLPQDGECQRIYLNVFSTGRKATSLITMSPKQKTPLKCMSEYAYGPSSRSSRRNKIQHILFCSFNKILVLRYLLRSLPTRSNDVTTPKLVVPTSYPSPKHLLMKAGEVTMLPKSIRTTLKERVDSLTGTFERVNVLNFCHRLFSVNIEVDCP